MHLADLIINYDSKRIPLSAKQREHINKIYPYYGAQGVIDYVDDYLFDGEYMLIAEDGENLRSRKLPIATIVSGKFWVNNHAHIITSNEKSNLLFVWYWLNNNDISQYVTGSAQPKLNQSNLNAIPFPDIDKEIQDKIAFILADFENKISSNSDESDTLQATIELMYQNWFNDSNCPNNIGVLESGIPKDWEYRPFNEFIKPFSEKIGGLEVPIYSTTNNGLSLRDEKFNKNLTKSKGNNKKIVKDDLIFGLSREILNFGVFEEENGSVSPAYQTFKIDQTVMLPFMLELEMRINMPKYMDILQLGAREGQGIRKDYLLKKEYLVPKMEVQLQFAEIYTVIQKKIALLKEENKVLAEIRDALIPQFMSGELPVEVGEE